MSSSRASSRTAAANASDRHPGEDRCSATFSLPRSSGARSNRAPSTVSRNPSAAGLPWNAYRTVLGTVVPSSYLVSQWAAAVIRRTSTGFPAAWVANPSAATEPAHAEGSGMSAAVRPAAGAMICVPQTGKPCDWSVTSAGGEVRRSSCGRITCTGPGSVAPWRAGVQVPSRVYRRVTDSRSSTPPASSGGSGSQVRWLWCW